MLILTRKVGQKIMIGDDITVVVLGISGLDIKLGIGAPRSVSVHREEVFLKVNNGDKNE